jgi:hypothetical protein
MKYFFYRKKLINKKENCSRNSTNFAVDEAATQGFSMESNLSVITEDGSYYTFNVKYSDEPVKLTHIASLASPNVKF